MVNADKWTFLSGDFDITQRSSSQVAQVLKKIYKMQQRLKALCHSCVPWKPEELMNSSIALIEA